MPVRIDARVVVYECVFVAEAFESLKLRGTEVIHPSGGFINREDVGCVCLCVVCVMTIELVVYRLILQWNLRLAILRLWDLGISSTGFRFVHQQE